METVNNKRQWLDRLLICFNTLHFISVFALTVELGMAVPTVVASLHAFVAHLLSLPVLKKQIPD